MPGMSRLTYHPTPSGASGTTESGRLGGRYTSRRTMRSMSAAAAILALGCAWLAAALPPASPTPAPAAVPAATPSSAPAERVESDEYTRYELLAPETAQFHILYEVTAIAAGAT